MKNRTPLFAAACNSGLATGALADVSSVVIIGTCASRLDGLDRARQIVGRPLREHVPTGPDGEVDALESVLHCLTEVAPAELRQMAEKRQKTRAGWAVIVVCRSGSGDERGLTRGAHQLTSSKHVGSHLETSTKLPAAAPAPKPGAGQLAGSHHAIANGEHTGEARLPHRVCARHELPRVRLDAGVAGHAGRRFRPSG